MHSLKTEPERLRAGRVATRTIDVATQLCISPPFLPGKAVYAVQVCFALPDKPISIQRVRLLRSSAPDKHSPPRQTYNVRQATIDRLSQTAELTNQ